MRKTVFALCLLATALFVSGPAQAAREPTRYTLGATTLELVAPTAHKWIDKRSEIGLKLAPERYSGLIDHLISIYALSSTGSITKLYNNYCALFYVGPPEKDWSAADFAALKSRLLNAREASEEEQAAGREYLRAFLLEGLGYKISSSKSRKYYAYLRDVALIRDEPEALLLSLRIRKKGEKTKHVTVSLSLVRGKLLGTLYYQVAPGGRERERAQAVTKAWQEALIAANG